MPFFCNQVFRKFPLLSLTRKVRAYRGIYFGISPLKIYNTPCTFRAPKARGGYRSALPLLQSVATKRMLGCNIPYTIERSV